MDDVGLLQVGLRRCRERAREQQLEQRGRHGLPGEFSMRAVTGHARELVEPRQGRVKGERGAEALRQRGFDAVSGIRRRVHERGLSREHACYRNAYAVLAPEKA
ncbi:hypothetical protein D3C83_21710 [compost metagenome]